VQMMPKQYRRIALRVYRTYAMVLATIGLTHDNVVQPHFVWSRFLASHTDAAVKNRETRFFAWITGSEGEPHYGT